MHDLIRNQKLLTASIPSDDGRVAELCAKKNRSLPHTRATTEEGEDEDEQGMMRTSPSLEERASRDTATSQDYHISGCCSRGMGYLGEFALHDDR